MRKVIQKTKKIIPNWMKGYKFMRYARIFTTPIIGTYHYLLTTGQLRSVLSGKPVSSKGDPLPWFSYPAINFLNQLEINGHSVFEYGAGNSTLYWINKGCTTCSVEANESWANYIIQKTPSTKILLETDLTKYAKAILLEDTRYDIIVVDGASRDLCARHAIDRLKSDGLIILDNSEAYTGVAQFLRQSGLLQIDFIGPAPITHAWQTTSFFFSSGFRLPCDTPPHWINGMTIFPKGWKPL